MCVLDLDFMEENEELEYMAMTTLGELINELHRAYTVNCGVSYVMRMLNSNFSYVGYDLDLATMRYTESTDCLTVNTLAGGELVLPNSYDIEVHEMQEVTEYVVRDEEFTVTFLFHRY